MRNTRIEYLIKKFGGVSKMASSLGVSRVYINDLKRLKFKTNITQKLRDKLLELGYPMEFFITPFNEEWRVYKSDEKIEYSDLIDNHGFDKELEIHVMKRSKKYIYYQVIGK